MSTIFYIHGFGGRDNAPDFHVELNRFLRNNKLQFELRTKSWDSFSFDLSVIASNFIKAKSKCSEIAKELITELVNKEELSESYYVIGFSLGANVVRETLNLSDRKLKGLRGIYLLGAAFDSDEKLDEYCIPKTCMCINYYSSVWDHVLKFYYKNVSGKDAAGAVGLRNTSLFQNMHVQSAHIGYSNYNRLACAVGYLISWDNNQKRIENGYINLKFPTSGKSNWNNIYQTENVCFQQNRHTGHYRAIQSKPPYARLAWGNNLHTIFHEVGL